MPTVTRGSNSPTHRLRPNLKRGSWERAGVRPPSPNPSHCPELTVANGTAGL
ncbi:uncharacterized protein EI90DRAFT_3055215 [Cantharellus anzutake]|uniref:uncharacterized protein n=1 Tax=Cantharellus anzutake TaxID=1750568 RepID=UPI0019030467|nr:uncharacterized protein EI90DRAFT_3055215 [Cantharellus anzutake]KAF8332355.1 hypothetical protein EI90DRAFT_3055215 [Cantharellus anzutake]